MPPSTPQTRILKVWKFLSFQSSLTLLREESTLIFSGGRAQPKRGDRGLVRESICRSSRCSQEPGYALGLVWFGLWELKDGKELILYEVLALGGQTNIGAAASRPTSFFDAVYLYISVLTSTSSAADLITMKPDKAAKILF